jgi:class 3 adenylate cyclase
LKQKTIEEQRKLVTVLFADLVGFTSIAEKSDPEDAGEVLAAYFTCWKVATQHYGGLKELV